MWEKRIENKRGESMKKRRRWRLNNVDWDAFQGELDEMQWSEVTDVKEMNDRLTENVRLAAERKIGIKRVANSKRDNKPWWNVDISCARKERKRLNKECRRLRTARMRGEEVSDVVYNNAWNEYQVKRKVVKSLIRKAVERHEKNVINELREKDEEGQKEWYKFMRCENRAKRTEVKELKVNDVIVSGMEEIKNAISEHWERIGGVNEELQKDGPVFQMEQKRLDEMDDEPDEEEIRKVCKMLKNGKSAGNDKIPYEMYKFGGPTICGNLKELYVEIWRNEKVPESWNETRVTLLHKGGCKSKKELKNYISIAVADTVGKIFCMVLNGRLKVNVERNGVYSENQNGFRALRRGEDNMYVICEVIERMKKEGKKVYMAFLDIEKAYDKVNRSILWKVLERCGMTEKIVNIIKSMYVNTRGKYALGELETDWVKSVKGVRQGCILSPLLFGLYTEELSVRVNKCNKGVRVGDSRLNVLLYADDIVVMSESSEDLQEVLNVVAGYGNDFNVSFSDEKSEVLIVNGLAHEGENGWMLGDKKLKRTKEYKYLGMWINEDGSGKEMREKMFKARQWSGRLASVARMRGNK